MSVGSKQKMPYYCLCGTGTFWDSPKWLGEWVDLGKVEALFASPLMGRGLQLSKENTKPQASCILDLKRATQIGIRMSRLPLPWREIPNALRGPCDEVFTCEEARGEQLCFAFHLYIQYFYKLLVSPDAYVIACSCTSHA